MSHLLFKCPTSLSKCPTFLFQMSHLSHFPFWYVPPVPLSFLGCLTLLSVNSHCSCDILINYKINCCFIFCFFHFHLLFSMLRLIVITNNRNPNLTSISEQKPIYLLSGMHTGFHKMS